MDSQLVEKIVHEVKSQGVFDEFRKDSIADVDTKPAYQNLRQRVENAVKKFLSEQKWTPETNKNQLREKLRKHITESGFLDVGVERIVDQVVNPKIGSVFQPRIEEIAYKYLGLPPPQKKFEPPPPPLMHPLPPLPLSAPPPLKVETCSLLPTDLEQVSPDSDKGTIKSEERDDRTPVDMETDEKLVEDEEESPPFEPLVKQEQEEPKDEKPVKQESNDDIKRESDISLEDERHQPEEANGDLIKKEIITSDNTNSQELSSIAIDSSAVDKEASHFDARIFQDSQLSSVSSDSHLSFNGKEDSMQSSSQEPVSANISEEAQMPKFNENSCEPTNFDEKAIVKSELHFDIKKDEIKFEGTERKTGLEPPSDATIKSEEEKYTTVDKNPVADIKNDTFQLSSTNLIMDAKYDDIDNTPNAQELSFGSSIDDSSSIPATPTPKSSGLPKEQEESPQIQTPKQLTQTTPTSTPTPTSSATTPTATPSPNTSHRTDKEHQSRHSSSSSSKHKKHSKERRRSYERERDKDSTSRDRHRSSKDIRDSSKNHSSSSATKSSKHSSSSMKYSSQHKSTSDKDLDKSSSSSTHFSSKHIKHSNSHSSMSSYENQDYKKSKRDSDKKHSLSSSGNHREHSSSSASKRSERKDDHSEAKYKAQRRKSTDSNDEGGDKSFGNGGGNKSSTQYTSTSNTKSSKYKSDNSDTNKAPSTKTNGTQRDDINQQNDNEATKKTNFANNVVILNDILENPQTQFIQLNNTGHLVETPSQKCSTILSDNKPLETPEHNNNIEPSTLKFEEEEKPTLNTLPDLFYFEEIQPSLNERLRLLNGTMDLCRNAVNSLRFDSISDEGIELSNEEDANNDYKSKFLMESLKRKADFSYEDYETTPRKRMISNESEGCQVKTSPAPSDSSFNSKENEEIPKNTDHANKSLVNRHKAVQKLNQQQRYSSEDLYKPRPILGQRSRRRGMDSII